MHLVIRLGFVALGILGLFPKEARAADAERDGPRLSIARLFRAPIRPEDELLVGLTSSEVSKVVNTLAKIEKKYSKSTNAHTAIKKLLADPRPPVRRKAARVLGNIRATVDDTDVRNICSFLRSTDSSEVVDGLKALRGLDAPQATAEILPLLQNPDEGVIRDACRTLAEIGSLEVIPLIQLLTNHADKHVRADAQRAIYRLQIRTASSTSGRNSRPSSSGTGFVVADGGYILTCEHVVKGSKSVKIRDTSGNFHSSTVVASDPSNDLCLLLAPTLTNAPIKTVEANSVVVGQTVYCLGYPLEGGEAKNLTPVVGNGVVASLRGIEGDTRHIQVTVAMNPGNSGGPVFDESGRWMGVAAHKLADLYSLRKSGQLPQGFNFAIKSSLAVNLFDTVPDTKLAVGMKTEKVPLEVLVKRLSQSVVYVIAK